LVIVVASSAPVRHGFPAGIISASGRPLRYGRPYSSVMAAPSTVHSDFTCGLPPPPVPVCVVLCSASGTATVHARAIARYVVIRLRIQVPPSLIVVNASPDPRRSWQRSSRRRRERLSHGAQKCARREWLRQEDRLHAATASLRHHIAIARDEQHAKIGTLRQQ